MFISQLRGFRLLFFSIALLMGWGLYAIQPVSLNKLALQFEDNKYQVSKVLGLSPQVNDNIVIVAVDETSVNRLGRWPWSRSKLAKLFEGMSEASLVGIDIVFSEPTQANEDAQLAQSVANLKTVIAGFFFRDQATAFADSASLDQLQECAYLNYKIQSQNIGLKEFPYVETNIPLLADAVTSCAFFNTESDVDGIYRRYPLAYIHKGDIYPPLAVQAMRYYLNKDARLVLNDHGIEAFTLHHVVLKQQNDFQLNFYPFDSRKFISAVNVIEKTVPAGFFNNKIVLLGVTEIGVADIRPTPDSAVTPGVWLHYTALANLLNNDVLHRSSNFDLGLLIFTLLVLLGIGYLTKIWQRIVCYVGGLCLVYAIANIVFIHDNIWLREFFTLLSGAFFIVCIEAYTFIRTEYYARELKRAFSSYVSPDIVESLLANPNQLKLGGSERTVSILFTDIRGFTRLSEQMDAQQLVKILTEIREPLTQVILNNKGMLDKYIGDAVMALFNAPLNLDNHADMAVRSALDIMESIKDINHRFQQQGLPEIAMGVGINTGLCVVGNMGSSIRFEYTAIGDPVNLASRLEGLCKIYQCPIIISEFTRSQLSKIFLVRLLDKVLVKGKTEPVTIYEVMEDTAFNRDIKDKFEQALQQYFSGEFLVAKNHFHEIALQYRDSVSVVFSERCKNSLKI